MDTSARTRLPLGDGRVERLAAARNAPRDDHGRLLVQGAVSWLPAVLGCTLAGVALSRLLGEEVWGMDRLPGRHWRRMSPADEPSRARKDALLEQVGLGRPRRDPGEGS